MLAAPPPARPVVSLYISPKVTAMRAIETTVALPADQAEIAVRAALADQGFGILTEIDVAATLAAKLGVDRPPLKILGACNPGFAHQALQLDPSAALVIPCNVVLEPDGSGGTRISVSTPRAHARPGVRRASPMPPPGSSPPRLDSLGS